MKTKKVFGFLTVLLLIATTPVFAGNKTEKFKVYGNCGSCEKRIETAAKSVDGVTKADWNKDTKIIEVSYDDSKTDLQKVNLAIAKVGHDTETVKATEESYSALPACCQYERKAEE